LARTTGSNIIKCCCSCCLHQSNVNRSEQPNIINVAISRAKEEIIIVGNEYRLSENSNSLTGKLMLHIKKTSSYQSEQNILLETSQK
jgi:CO dehydrogenase/acetyl-CoA synthase epsilon subunit